MIGKPEAARSLDNKLQHFFEILNGSLLVAKMNLRNSF
jgi:hypothetical protein